VRDRRRVPASPRRPAEKRSEPHRASARPSAQAGRLRALPSPPRRRRTRPLRAKGALVLELRLKATTRQTRAARQAEARSNRAAASVSHRGRARARSRSRAAHRRRLLRRRGAKGARSSSYRGESRRASQAPGFQIMSMTMSTIAADARARSRSPGRRAVQGCELRACARLGGNQGHPVQAPRRSTSIRCAQCNYDDSGHHERTHECGGAQQMNQEDPVESPE
jgi:hypothetical protein